MIKGTPELIQARREEIVEACRRLYQQKGFREISICDISAVTSISRPSIYNYFETKEEIFLALFEQEYWLWTKALQKIVADNEKLSKTAFAQAVAESLVERTVLLKLLAMNLYDMEDNSRMERLLAFKQAFRASMQAMEEMTKRYFGMNEQQRDSFIMAFYPFMMGIYPCAFSTPKQREAMQQVGIRLRQRSVYQLTFDMLLQLLHSGEKQPVAEEKTV